MGFILRGSSHQNINYNASQIEHNFCSTKVFMDKTIIFSLHYFFQHHILKWKQSGSLNGLIFTVFSALASQDSLFSGQFYCWGEKMYFRLYQACVQKYWTKRSKNIVLLGWNFITNGNLKHVWVNSSSQIATTLSFHFEHQCKL